MKKYEYVRMKYKMWDGVYIHKEEKGKLNHREVIDDFAARGYRFVGTVPVSVEGYGRIREFDLVFEIDE